MTPLVRRWLLSMAEEDLRNAEDEEAYCRRELTTIQGLLEGGTLDEPLCKREIEKAGQALAEASAQAALMASVVRELTEAAPRDPIDVAWDRGRL